ncbi:MAG: hypothetical protein J0G32_07775 [Alphaproteobacteria bacterium]|nr:hypothetical protein [Alphaproteobacteria bacterium]
MLEKLHNLKRVTKAGAPVFKFATEILNHSKSISDLPLGYREKTQNIFNAAISSKENFYNNVEKIASDSELNPLVRAINTGDKHTLDNFLQKFELEKKLNTNFARAVTMCLEAKIDNKYRVLHYVSAFRCDKDAAEMMKIFKKYQADGGVNLLDYCGYSPAHYTIAVGNTMTLKEVVSSAKFTNNNRQKK